MRQFWIVNDDETRVWSSEAAAYVDLPEGMFLTAQAAFAAGYQSPDLAEVVPTRIASEDDLWSVLRDRFPSGLPEDQKPPRLVFKRLIVDRLQTAGLLEAARAAIDAADLYTQERWNSRDAIYADDPTALALLSLIDGDPAVIFGP